MKNYERYSVLSLELHLFFARIMKEHSLFLEAGFTPANANFTKEAEYFKDEFENLLFHTIRLSDGIVSKAVLDSGEVVTEFTEFAEQQTGRFTGIKIDEELTVMEKNLRYGQNVCIRPELYRQVQRLNQKAMQLLDELIAFKEGILKNVLSCKMFTMNYPLLIEHIIREAKLYRTYVYSFENGMDFDFQTMKQIEQFWNQIMMEHALFIRSLLDPSENELVETSQSFAKDYERLLATSRQSQDRIIENASLEETIKFRDFKVAGVKGIEECKIRSIILPLLADHVLREANHYIRLLS